MNLMNAVMKAMQLKGHTIFEDDSKPFNLNYVGIRDISGVGTFNDTFVVFYKYKGQWTSFVRMGTTDPGTYYLENPLNVEGTAILKAGQHRGVWTLGKHQGKYPALVQAKEVTVIRDFDRDAELDVNNGKEDTGFFGINHHRANSAKESQIVGKWSAGCQVTQNPDEYDIFIELCRKSAEYWGSTLSYTLLEKADVKL